jgi:putative transposase
VRAQDPALTAANKKLAADVPAVVEFITSHGIKPSDVAVLSTSVTEVHPRDEQGIEQQAVTLMCVTEAGGEGQVSRHHHRGAGIARCDPAHRALNVIRALLFAARALFRTRGQLAIEILAVRHQLGVLQRAVKRPRLTNADRGVWVLLSRFWGRWRDALIIVKPATVIKWHRAGFGRYWTWRSRPKGGRPGIDPEVRALIKRRATANMWGAPRIHGELLKLGIYVSEATVSKYMPRRSKPPSQTWRTFLDTYPMLPISLRSIEHGAHVHNLVSVDFFTVPTVFFHVLFVFVVLAHDRRRILGINVTSSPSAAWTANQIRRAFPWETAPRYLLRDRDSIDGAYFRRGMQNLGIKEVVIA